ncbi:MAG TPA: methyl-accepting chemotaxis protein [Xanthobacteraceae bacterium]|nr:methyl-accepting chemotaxis protein [Xanthobacteraceae bacterium]
MRASTGHSLRVRGKILTLFGISAALLIGAAAFSFWEFYSSLRMFEHEVMLSQSDAINIEALESDFKKQVQEWKDTLLRGKKPEALQQYWGNFQKRETDVHGEAVRLSREIPDPETAQLVTQFLSAHEKMGEAYRRAFKEFSDRGFDSSVGDAAVAGMDRAPTDLLTKAKDLLLAQASAQATEAKNAADLAVKLSLALFLVIMAASVIAFQVAVQKSISAPLSRLAAAMRELASGKFEVILPGLGRKDEIGDIAQAVEEVKVVAVEKARREADEILQRQKAEAEARARVAEDEARLAKERERAAREQAVVLETLADALSRLSQGDLGCRLDQGFSGAYARVKDDFNAAVARLRETVEAIVAAASEVAGASAEISTSTTNLSQRTEEQAASLEETSASMQEISATVRRNAENAVQADHLTSGSREVANRGGQVVAKAVTAMARIEESSRKISDIIGVIDEIARQTNLLALNAAVEAARAGDAGRGFAVVASEVRSLAQRSAQAAKDIKDLIINSSGEVQEGVGLVNEAGTSLAEIMASIKQVADIVAEIAAASQSQSSGIDQINRALTQMDEVTQQNSALVEENAASAKTLERQAKIMSDRVAFFRTGDEAGAGRKPVGAEGIDATPLRRARRA